MHPLALQILDRWFTPAYREQHPGEMETVRQMISATNAEGYAGCCAVLRDTDLRSEIAVIETPCLVIAGTHDPATPPSDGFALHSALRNSSYLELDASHLSAWEQAEEFAGAVLAFLATEERSDG
jgi:3-oxoadipate enol-lactonase